MFGFSDGMITLPELIERFWQDGLTDGGADGTYRRRGNAEEVLEPFPPDVDRSEVDIPVSFHGKALDYQTSTARIRAAGHNGLRGRLRFFNECPFFWHCGHDRSC